MKKAVVAFGLIVIISNVYQMRNNREMKFYQEGIVSNRDILAKNIDDLNYQYKSEKLIEDIKYRSANLFQIEEKKEALRETNHLLSLTLMLASVVIIVIISKTKNKENV